MSELLAFTLGGGRRAAATCSTGSPRPWISSWRTGFSHLVHVRPGVGSELPQRLDDVGYRLELLGSQGQVQRLEYDTRGCGYRGVSGIS